MKKCKVIWVNHPSVPSEKGWYEVKNSEGCIGDSFWDGKKWAAKIFESTSQEKRKKGVHLIVSWKKKKSKYCFNDLLEELNECLQNSNFAFDHLKKLRESLSASITILLELHE